MIWMIDVDIAKYEQICFVTRAEDGSFIDTKASRDTKPSSAMTQNRFFFRMTRFKDESNLPKFTTS